MDENLTIDGRTWLTIMRHCGSRACSVVNTILGDARVNIAQFNTMGTIEERKEVTMSEIAREQGITMGAGTSLIDNLVDAGWVSRRRSESDRRVVKVSLTPEGSKVLKKCTETLMEFWVEVFAKIEPEERKRYFQTYRKVLDISRSLWDAKARDYDTAT